MKIFNMKRLIYAMTAMCLATCLTSCVVEYTPHPYSPIGYNGYSNSYNNYSNSSSAYRQYNRYSNSSSAYRQYNYNCRKPTITPVSHGFDPDPQYVRGYVFRGGDGMPYAAEF